MRRCLSPSARSARSRAPCAVEQPSASRPAQRPRPSASVSAAPIDAARQPRQRQRVPPRRRPAEIAPAPLRRRFVQRTQIEPLAARADRRQQAVPARWKQHQHGARRRFFQHLQQRVGGVVVHVVGRIDDGDAPAAGADVMPKKPASRRISSTDSTFISLPVLGLMTALQHQQAGMRLRRDLHGRRIVLRHGQIVCARVGRAIGQQISRDAIGQCRLADARRPGDQPGLGGRPLRMRARRAPAPRPARPGAGLARMGKPSMRSVSIGFAAARLGHAAL